MFLKISVLLASLFAASDAAFTKVSLSSGQLPVTLRTNWIEDSSGERVHSFGGFEDGKVIGRSYTVVTDGKSFQAITRNGGESQHTFARAAVADVGKGTFIVVGGVDEKLSPLKVFREVTVNSAPAEKDVVFESAFPTISIDQYAFRSNDVFGEDSFCLAGGLDASNRPVASVTCYSRSDFKELYSEVLPVTAAGARFAYSKGQLFLLNTESKASNARLYQLSFPEKKLIELKDTLLDLDVNVASSFLPCESSLLISGGRTARSQTSSRDVWQTEIDKPAGVWTNKLQLPLEAAYFQSFVSLPKYDAVALIGGFLDVGATTPALSSKDFGLVESTPCNNVICVGYDFALLGGGCGCRSGRQFINGACRVPTTTTSASGVTTTSTAKASTSTTASPNNGPAGTTTTTTAPNGNNGGADGQAADGQADGLLQGNNLYYIIGGAAAACCCCLFFLICFLVMRKRRDNDEEQPDAIGLQNDPLGRGSMFSSQMMGVVPQGRASGYSGQVYSMAPASVNNYGAASSIQYGDNTYGAAPSPLNSW